MDYPLLLPKKILLYISILGFLIIFLGAIFKITHWSFLGISGNILIAIGFLSIISWIIVVIDVIRNQTKNWWLWLFCLLIFGNIAAIIYLLKRGT